MSDLGKVVLNTWVGFIIIPSKLSERERRALSRFLSDEVGYVRNVVLPCPSTKYTAVTNWAYSLNARVDYNTTTQCTGFPHDFYAYMADPGEITYIIARRTNKKEATEAKHAKQEIEKHDFKAKIIWLEELLQHNNKQ